MKDKNRLKNIFWTVSDLYNFDIFKFSLKPEDSYEAAILGYASKYFYFYTIDDFFKRYINNLNNKKDLWEISKLIIENIFSHEMILERPGTLDFKKSHDEEILKHLNRQKIILTTELKIGYIRKERGKFPKVQKVLEEMLDEIYAFKSLDTFQYLEFLKYLFEKYFHINKNLPHDIDESYEDFKREAKSNSSSNKNRPYNRKKFVDNTFLERYNIESAEFTFFNDDYRDINVKEDNFKNNFGDQNIYEALEKHYGIEKIKRHVADKIASKIATDIHSDIKIYFPSGEFKNKNSYFAKEEKNNYLDNLKFYEDNKVQNQRAARELSSIIKNSLLRESEDETVKSKEGNIIASEIWKSKALNEYKIFSKINHKDSNEIFVDILLDSSASQNKRKEIVATESYIIAEALTNLNIKTRVFSYNNFYNYLVIKKYRDYNDPQTKNMNIFKYSPSGSNRDGLAIKFMRHLISKNYDSRRFLIILTDGLPFDEIDIGVVGTSKIPGENYKDDEAVMDTSKEVLLTRLMGINTFGVFTGEESESLNIKKIYGNDYAYITNIARFHKVVGIFLKTYANKIE
ncbi:hypothetical protein HKO22_05480 [Peptoniphilus sp. AGMB00490]|uniref:Nitric oxide reductase activation protein n=1 Tax=Peptoniphilus faecalis TaxID=2731255 RepID=A0A848RLK0_9FIRM|nr:hypothetical protein [Peptoniphilus faecalis]NMW85192.1 hypothetical protein [Peptoniphilus faecalis]